MPKLTTDEFITLYKHNPNDAFQWIKENETEVPTLFTTLESITPFGQVASQKLRDFFAQELPPETSR